MDTTLRRLAVTGALAVTPALGLAVPASADGVDLEAVTESIIESGYYVDSRAKYFKSDKAQELLRSAQGRAVPVFVAVVPAGNRPEALLAALPGKLERKGTYAVLAGDQLRVASDTEPAAKVKAVYAKAVKAYPARPDAALVSFVRGMPVSKYAPPAPGKPGNDGRPAPEQSVPLERTLAGSQPTAPAAGSAEARKAEAGGVPVLPLAAGGVAVLAAAGGGLLLWRRKRTPAAPTPDA
ncbi:hypothetical protein [Actinomadura flavalba]|uniref:hypothetical protein n=1 Tax=Actinomadura flavalba TaxID=1120938 RepID=UPI00036F7844|nr:hypothetical protein [Actinomadura flavalba]